MNTIIIIIEELIGYILHIIITYDYQNYSSNEYDNDDKRINNVDIPCNYDDDLSSCDSGNDFNGSSCDDSGSDIFDSGGSYD